MHCAHLPCGIVLLCVHAYAFDVQLFSGDPPQSKEFPWPKNHPINSAPLEDSFAGWDCRGTVSLKVGWDRSWKILLVLIPLPCIDAM